MSDERILEVVERQDKYYILGFINGLKANRDELLRENEELKNNWAELKKWLYEEHCLYIPEIARNSTYQVVLDKMKKMEKVENNE